MEWLMLAGAFAFIAVLTRTADDMKGTEDDDGYNSERGIQEDQHPSRKSDAQPHGQGAIGSGNGRDEPPTR
jgi:hypothetical protein